MTASESRLPHAATSEVMVNKNNRFTQPPHKPLEKLTAKVMHACLHC